MSTDAEYQKAFNQWEKVQRNCIKQIEYNIQNSERMIEVHSESLELSRTSLQYEKELLESAITVNEKQKADEKL